MAKLITHSRPRARQKEDEIVQRVRDRLLGAVSLCSGVLEIENGRVGLVQWVVKDAQVDTEDGARRLLRAFSEGAEIVVRIPWTHPRCCRGRVVVREASVIATSLSQEQRTFYLVGSGPIDLL
jgi:hypothetical protein